MNRVRSLIQIGWVVAAIGVLTPIRAAGQTELVVNGGFEDPIDFSTWTVEEAFTGSHLVCDTNASNAHNGERSAQFGAHEGQPDILSKHFATLPGGSYRLSFWLASNNIAAVHDSFAVLWDNQVIFELSNPQSGFSYQSHEFNVPATTGSTELAFQGYKRFGAFRLDDVSVVPAPASDLCDDAPLIEVGTWYGNNGDSTHDIDPNCGQPDARDVWYRFIAPCNTITIDTCGSDFDTTLSLWWGPCWAMEQIGEVACNDDAVFEGCGPRTSRLTASVTPGDEYHIRIAGYRDDHWGNYVLNVSTPTADNDTCASATPVQSGQTYTGHNNCAATEGPAPGCSPASNDVWFVYRPWCNETLEISTCGSDFDTVLSVWTGECGALQQIACNDEVGANSEHCPDTHASFLSVPLTRNTVYYIQLAGFYNNDGGAYSLRLESASIPTNQSCETAAVVGDGPNEFHANCAYNSSGMHCDGPSYWIGIWFTYTASCSGWVSAGVCYTSPVNAPGILSVYSGTCGDLLCRDSSVFQVPTCPGVAQPVYFEATEGETYYLCLTTFQGPPLFDGTLTVHPFFPVNDRCETAGYVSDGEYSGSTICASDSPSFWCEGHTSGPGLWYRYSAPCDGRLVLDTCGSDFDTAITVYRSPGQIPNYCDHLYYIDCVDNDDRNCPGQPGASYIDVPVTADQEYFIRVGGVGDARGHVRLHVNTVLDPPANDNCAAPLPLVLGSTTSRVVCSTPDGPAACFPEALDVWYTLTPMADGQLTLDTCGTYSDTILSLYTGTCGNLSLLECNDDAGSLGNCPQTVMSYIEEDVTAGVTYLIRVGLKTTESGPVTLNAALSVLNDTCATAITVYSDAVVTGDTTGATNEMLGACDLSIGNPPPDVWYRWVPDNCTNRLILDTCGSVLDTVITVYTGECGALTEIACNDDNGGRGPCPDVLMVSYLEVPVSLGTNYWVRLGGFAGSGPFTLRFTRSVNNSCAAALPVGNGVTEFDGQCGAIDDTGTPVSCGRPNQATLWFSYVAPCSGAASVDLCGSMYDTVVSVHQGSCGSLTEMVCNDNADETRCPENPFNSYVEFPATAGTVYVIRVSSFDDELSSGTMRIACTPHTGCTADLNGDGQVSLADLATLLSHFGMQGATLADGDVSGDGAVTLADLAILMGQFGADCS